MCFSKTWFILPYKDLDIFEDKVFKFTAVTGIQYDFLQFKLVTKICVITFTYLPTKEVLDYPLEYASIFYKGSIITILQVVQNAVSWLFNNSI